jgi:TetR/AcrR family transcriptional regulator, transcriptional repressor for nem operon
MTKSERTRRFIIEKTAPVFNTNGFDGTSLTVLQETTGLTKGSLYGNFRDKEEIALEAFRFSIRKVRGLFSERIAKQKTAKQKLLSLLTTYAEYVFNPPIEGGCPILNAAVAADDHNTFLRKAVTEEIEGIIDFVAGLVEEGKRSGEFKSDTKSTELAYIFFTSIEGAIMVSRVSSSDASMKAVVKHCRNILNLITK